MSHLETAFARLQAIPWETLGSGPDDEQLVELMGRFIGGIRAWAAYLDTGQRHVFHSLAAFVEPDLSLPDEMMEWLQQLDECGRIPIGRGRHCAIAGLQAYLCWNRLRDEGKLPTGPLPDPYEPLIQFFERGGGIYVEHGVMMTVYPNYVGFILTVEEVSPVHPVEDEPRDEPTGNEHVIRGSTRAEVEAECRRLRAKRWRIGEIKEVTISARRGSEEMVTTEYAAIARRGR